MDENGLGQPPKCNHCLFLEYDKQTPIDWEQPSETGNTLSPAFYLHSDSNGWSLVWSNSFIEKQKSKTSRLLKQKKI